MKFSKFILFIALIFIEYSSGLITKSGALISIRNNTNSQQPRNNKKIVKFNFSIQFVALFISKLNGASHDIMKSKVKKQCKLLKNSKMIEYMNSRIIQSKQSLKKLNNSAKADKRNRKSALDLMVVNMMRLFREMYQNLISCRQVYSKENLSLIKSLLKKMNSVIWKRCKTNCSIFDYSKIIIYFDKLVFFDKKTSKKKKKVQMPKIIENNVDVLIKLLKDYKELKGNNKKIAQKINKKIVNETMQFTPKNTAEDYKLLI